jgi:hypothetical protein
VHVILCAIKVKGAFDVAKRAIIYLFNWLYYPSPASRSFRFQRAVELAFVDAIRVKLLFESSGPWCMPSYVPSKSREPSTLPSKSREPLTSSEPSSDCSIGCTVGVQRAVPSTSSEPSSLPSPMPSESSCYSSQVSRGACHPMYHQSQGSIRRCHLLCLRCQASHHLPVQSAVLLSESSEPSNLTSSMLSEASTPSSMPSSVPSKSIEPSTLPSTTVPSKSREPSAIPWAVPPSPSH